MKKFLLSLAAVATMSFSANADIIQNGGFESWTDGTPDHWKTASSAGNATLEQSTDAHNGNYSVLVKGATSNKRLGYEEITLEAGTYNVTFYAKSLGGSTNTNGTQCNPGYATFNADGSINGNGYKYAGYVSIEEGVWTQVTFEFTLDVAQQICPVVMNPKNSGDMLIDDYTIVTSDGGTTDNPGGGDVDDPDTPPTDIQAITIAQFLAAADPNTTYQLTGTVANIKNTTYGNFDLVDETGSIYIYGLLNAAGETKKFAEMGIGEGDVLTLQGAYFDYNGTAEIKNAQYISHVKGSGTDPVDPVDPVDPEELTPDTPVNGDYFLNGNFEAWTDGAPDNWKSSTTASNATLQQSTDAHFGSYSVLVEGASSNKRLAYKELVLAKGTYTFSFYAKGEEGNEIAEVRPGYAPWKADGTLGSYVYSEEYYKVANEDGWTLVAHVFTLEETTKLNMVVMNPKNCGNVLIDDAKLVEGDQHDAIRTITTDNAIDLSNAVIYDILGKRVYNLDKKGVYVVNGKKVVIK